MPDIDQIADAVENFAESADARFEALEQRLDNLSPGAGSLGRLTEPDDLPGDAPQNTLQARPRPRAKVLGPTARHSETFGFNHFGDFAASVRNAGMPGGETDGRLMAAASTFGNEGSGTDGGFAIPPDFRSEIMEKVFGEHSLAALAHNLPVIGNSLTIPTSMTTPWAETGIQALWEAEAAELPQTKPQLQNVTIRLNKLACLIPVTDELLEDAAAMGALVARLAAEKIGFKLSRAIAFGTGAGMPLGFMNSPALVTQAKVSGQSGDTIVAENIVNMSSHLPVQSRASAVWLIHPDAEPKLSLMTIANQPVYMPPGGLRDTPFARLLGRPVIPHQVCETVGDLGDVMLVDLSQYLLAVKAGGVRSETSIHLWFDQGITAFRFVLRVAGQPWWSEVTTSRDGSFTQSPFITLAERT